VNDALVFMINLISKEEKIIFLVKIAFQVMASTSVVFLGKPVFQVMVLTAVEVLKVGS
jgi:hypothetical protein